MIFSGFCLFLTLAVGSCVLALVLILRLSEEARRLGHDVSPLVDAAMEIRLEALEAHLLTEEIMGGDSAEDPKQVWQHLEASRAFGLAMLEGGESTEGTFVATSDPGVRAMVQKALVSLDTVTEMTQARFALLDRGQGAGSDADILFDDTYDQITNDLATLAQSPAARDDATIQKAIGEARYSLAHGHLILAEILGGDMGENLSEVTGSFSNALDSLALLATLPGAPVDQLRQRISELSDLAATRHARNIETATDLNRSDVAYDAVFQDFLDSADAAETMVQAHITAELDGQKALRYSSIAGFGIAALALIGSSLLAYVTMSRKVVNQIVVITQSVEAIGKGDIAADIPSGPLLGELARLRDAVVLFRDSFERQAELEEEARSASAVAQQHAEDAARLAEGYAGVNDQLGDSGRIVEDRARDCVSIAEALNDAQSRQSSVLEEILNNMKSIETAVDKNDKTSSDARAIAGQVKQLIEEGRAVIETTIQAVGNIADSGRQVMDFISEIEDISFQTSLLALNAGVEAARAGEAGKGFSIVAHEVRALSSKTTETARNIMDSLSRTRSFIDTGSASVDDTARHMDEIHQAIATLENGMADVENATENQVKALKSAVGGMDQFGRIFHETKRLSEKCLAAGHSMSEQARKLSSIATGSGETDTGHRQHSAPGRSQWSTKPERDAA